MDSTNPNATSNIEEGRGHRARRLIVILACALGLGGYIGVRAFVGKSRTIRATIVSVDPQRRVAVVEFVHPKTGEPVRVTNDVPDDCAIEIDRRAASLADLRPGAAVEVTGTIYRSGRVRPTRVVVLNESPRAATTAASAPID